METIEGFEWDEEKRLRTLRIRGIDFIDAAKVLLEQVFQYRSNQKGEERFVAIGPTKEGTLIAVVYMIRGQNLRIITARRAWNNEKRAYLHAVSVAPDERAD